MNFDIIGGGIGGMTTAIALQQKGITSTIYEQSKEIKPVGAGIILANNAMQVYDRLGLKEEIEDSGVPISVANVTTAQLNRITGMELASFEKKYKVRNVAIHRGVLQQILYNKLDPKNVLLGHKLSNITLREEEYQLSFENGQQVMSQGLLGADGIHSTVRNILFSENVIRMTNQVCWRGVVDYSLPDQYTDQVIESWEGRCRFGMVPISNNKVYWFAVMTFENSADEYAVENLGNYFKSFHPIVKDLIKETPDETIHTAILSDLQPIQKWHARNACLVGDAAHATTPNMGQGACQSIEGAYVLAECLSRYEIKRAFEIYQNLRIKKAHHVVNTSWSIGKVAHWTNPIATGLRNQLMRMIPASFNRKQSEMIFQLEL